LSAAGTSVRARGVDHFQSVQAASTATVHAPAACTGVLQTVNTSITNPDVPRNLTVTDTLADSTTGSVTVTGVLADGTSGNETIAITDNGTATGSKAFATITSYTVPASCAAGSTVSVGTGDKLGLSNALHGQNGVYKVRRNTADISIPSVDTTNSTVNMATITVNDSITIWYKY
jgi:hypothetical protein